MSARIHYGDSGAVTLTEPQARVLRLLIEAGALGRDFWQLHHALGRSPMQSIRVLRHKGLVEYNGGSYFAVRARPRLYAVATEAAPNQEVPRSFPEFPGNPAAQVREQPQEGDDA